ncbi:DUF262 domain-containing protein [Clostridium perfringens]|uniref:DUF262 domain-containing protein n=3 Tax=Clostridium perfringens TaxID=1502 RepID=UPI001A2E1823|nr:DUF262 domain-containing HNH endonuclease family protein [Clostridium perfringens]EHR0216778.1 DUF262 domain-containing protein [Clostridium perfringens]MDM0610997.1 DUF262 domain-containing HNH endonuclease family protein [Clostridium perfringens]MDM0616348.1 DUF262 domain-containing HNH endonuclease family protein [Clostridium perfringens]MDN4556995.1 DUF262 domain-containing HNH endonuclease family protein [Clostridium perfringens]MDT7987048.1 DUF262 domain-containing HNH endonuclease fa
MKANEKYLIRFLESSDKNFVIPVYQRNYDWKEEQCKQLYDDLVNMVKNDYKTHFWGTIVSIYNDSAKSREYLIIDGQQRITTISILLIAIYDILNKGILESKNIIKEKILNQYLINQYCNDESKIKLKPIKDDRKAFEHLINGRELIEESNITLNYRYFYNKIIYGEISIDELYDAIERLMIVEIELKNGEDDPQLIFESLNSTGLDLTDADKVRNFILMNQSAKTQEKLYNNYWNRVEKNTNYRVTQFIRDYLTMKENKIPNINKIYTGFKRYIEESEIEIEDCLTDMLKFSIYYKDIINNTVELEKANDIIKNINKLEVTVAYPFLLNIFDDYFNEIIKSDELIEILKVLESYIFRRIMCKAPTNALNKVFMNLNREIKKIPRYEEHYVDILKYVLINKKSSQRFPSEEEFKINFLECNVYNWKSKNKVYLLEKLENYDNNERVDIENLVNDKSLSIEHIMPQTLSLNWKKSLGENYSEIHAKYIGTIGNLTLTGYNSSLSNKSFIEKRDMKKGFKDSRLKLNKYLVDIDKWDEDTIKRRAENLFEIATNVWEYPISNYSLDNENNNLFSLEDDDDFTNTKVDKFIFKEDAIKVRNWTELYEKVLLGLYEVNPLPFSRLAKKEFSQEYLNRRFSNKERELRTPLKIDNNLYVEKNLSTESKLQTLRIIFDEYGIEYSELLFNIK